MKTTVEVKKKSSEITYPQVMRRAKYVNDKAKLFWFEQLKVV